MSGKNNIQIVAILKIKEEAISKAKPLFENLISSTRKEPGNLRYDCYTDSKDANTFVIIQTYVDAAALKQHQKSEHMKKNLGQMIQMLSGPPDIKVLKPQIVAAKL